MKKIIYSTITFILIITVILSCKKNNQTETINNSQNLGLFSSEEKITSLSNLSRFLGISSINRFSIDENSVRYKLEADFANINGHTFNLNEATFEYVKIKDDLLEINFTNKNESISLLINSTKKTIFYKEKNKILSENSSNSKLNEDERANVSMVVSLLIELTDSDIKRYEVIHNNDQITTQSVTCEYALSTWDTTKSRTTEGIAAHTKSYLSSHPDCHTIYGVDTGCIFGDFGCVSVQAVECHGASCN